MTTVLPLRQTPVFTPEFKSLKDRYNQSKNDFKRTLKQTQNVFKSVLFNSWLYADQKKYVLEQNQAYLGFIKSWKNIVQVIDCSLSKHDGDSRFHAGYEDVFKRIRFLQIQHSAYLVQMNQRLLDLLENPTDFKLIDCQITLIQLEMAKLNVQFLETIANPRAI